MTLRSFSAAATGALLLPAMAGAGGFLALNPNTGAPLRWDAEQDVVYNLDQGGLGLLTKEQADAMVDRSLQAWSSDQLDSVSLKLTRGDDLSVDHGVTSRFADNPALFIRGIGDGLTPIVYDQTGLLTDATFGQGSSQFVIGFATVQDAVGDTITEGVAVFNGRFLDGQPNPSDFSEQLYEGVVVHELGHMLNLDHSVFNESIASASVLPLGQDPVFTHYPTMHPLFHNDAATLAADDVAWISELYPADDYSPSKFRGTVTLEGDELDGVNVVARNVEDPLLAISCVSGFDNPEERRAAFGQTGNFLIPGLEPGSNWVLDFHPLREDFVEGSSVGTVEPVLLLPTAVEFINGAGTESGDDPVAQTTTFRAGPAGTIISGLDLVLNPNRATATASPTPGGALVGGLPQTDPVVLQPGVRTSITDTVAPLSGSAANGYLSLGNDPIEYWYAFTGIADLELNFLQLSTTSSAGLTLVVASFTQSGGSLTYSGEAFAGAAYQEVLTAKASTYSQGTAVAGQVLVGISAPTGSLPADFTLSVEASPADDAVIALGDLSYAGDGELLLTGRGFQLPGNKGVSLQASGVVIADATIVSDSQIRITISNPTPVDETVTIRVTSDLPGGYGGELTVPLAIPEANTLLSPAQQQALDALLGRLADGAPGEADINEDDAVDAADLTAEEE